MKRKYLGIFMFFLILSACTKEKLRFTNFKILEVKLTKMPFSDPRSGNWDPFDGPDVFFNMESAGNDVLFDGTRLRYKDVVPGDLPFAWNFINAYRITNLEVTHYVTLYDYDAIDPNDMIGYVGFTMKEYKRNHPKTITKESGGLTVTIRGEWF